MLKRPKISDDAIREYLSQQYEIDIHEIAFLPIGADFNSAAFRVEAKDGQNYFLKLRSGIFDEASVLLPQFLYENGMHQIIPVVPLKEGSLFGQLGSFKTILYPFIAGKNGYETTLTKAQWHELGLALRKFHHAQIPTEIKKLIRKESFCDRATERVKQFLHRAQDMSSKDIATKAAADLIQQEQKRITHLVLRAENLAKSLIEQPPQMIVCHTDLHAGNLHIVPSSELYIVDWDQPLIAPKERDLMYIGGGLLASTMSPSQEEALFYDAYGQTEINENAISYYRCQRIIQDICEYCTLFFEDDNDGHDDRAQSLIYLKANFAVGGTIDIAFQHDKSEL